MFDDLPQETIILARHQGWLTVTLNRPDARNALSTHMVREITNVLTRIDEEGAAGGVRGITLRGAGEAFCAGADLKELLAIADLPPDRAQSKAAEFSAHIASVMAAVRRARVVTIAAVHGPAMAGGLGLACACDYLLARSDATFALSETRIGLTPAQIAPYVIERVGPLKARQLMMTGTRLTAVKASQIGLVDHVMDDADSLATWENEVIEATLKCAPGAVAATKSLMDPAMREPRELYRQTAGAAFASCLANAEGREGVASFVEKRKPAWAQPHTETSS